MCRRYKIDFSVSDMASVSEKNTELQLTIMQHKLEKQMSDLAQQAMGGWGAGRGWGRAGPPQGAIRPRPVGFRLL